MKSFQTKDFLDVFFNGEVFNCRPLYSSKKTRDRLDEIIDLQPHFMKVYLDKDDVKYAGKLNEELIKLVIIKNHLKSRVSSGRGQVLNDFKTVSRNINSKGRKND